MQSISPGALGHADATDGCAGAERRGADLHGQTGPVGLRAGDLGDLLEGDVVLRVEFAGCAAGVDPAHAGAAVAGHLLGEATGVEFIPIGPGDDQGRPDTLQCLASQRRYLGGFFG